MDRRARIGWLRSTARISLIVGAICLTAACDSELVREAKRAEDAERVISNEMMQATYPESFRPGSPLYLERDFEAGVDFICDEIKIKKKHDVCADPDINWRR